MYAKNTNQIRWPLTDKESFVLGWTMALVLYHDSEAPKIESFGACRVAENTRSLDQYIYVYIS